MGTAQQKTKSVVITSLKLIIANLWRVFLSLLGPRVFCFCANLGSVLLSRHVRFEFHASGEYSASSDGMVRFFFDRELNYNAYEKGIVDRGQTLGLTYHLNYIDFSDGDLVVDVGANVGDIYIYFEALGINVEYVGFEPSPREFECLSKNIGSQVAHNLGLWSSNSSLTFFIESATGDSSFIEPPNYSSILTVPAVRLDEFLKQNPHRIRLLKLEAEGAEPEVLMGFEEGLHRCDYISADLGHERGTEEESTLPAVTNFLAERGFHMVAIGRSRLTALFKNDLAA